jgi:hypothetical protein
MEIVVAVVLAIVRDGVIRARDRSEDATKEETDANATDRDHGRRRDARMGPGGVGLHDALDHSPRTHDRLPDVLHGARFVLHDVHGMTGARRAAPMSRWAIDQRCHTCGGPLVALCMRCRGKVGGRAKTRRKLKAIRENLVRARAATAKRTAPKDG